MICTTARKIICFMVVQRFDPTSMTTYWKAECSSSWLRHHFWMTRTYQQFSTCDSWHRRDSFLTKWPILDSSSVEKGGKFKILTEAMSPFPEFIIDMFFVFVNIFKNDRHGGCLSIQFSAWDRQRRQAHQIRRSSKAFTQRSITSVHGFHAIQGRFPWMIHKKESLGKSFDSLMVVDSS